jgi:PilZ domain
MTKTFASLLNAPTETRKTIARTALVDLKESSRTLLVELFRQFNIETIVMSADAVERLSKEKFEACVVRLGGGAASVMESVRNSTSNRRSVIYGVGGSAQEAMRYSKYSVNAMFQEPLERPAAHKLVRATRMLVLHEFRRYIRVPIMTEVSVACTDGRRFSANSVDMSAGGMALKSGEDISAGTNLDVSFALMTLPRVSVRGVVAWRKPKSFGVCFDPGDQHRQKIKQWIDTYLEI